MYSMVFTLNVCLFCFFYYTLSCFLVLSNARVSSQTSHISIAAISRRFSVEIICCIPFIKIIASTILFLISHRIRLGFLTACEIIHKALYQIDWSMLVKRPKLWARKQFIFKSTMFYPSGPLLNRSLHTSLQKEQHNQFRNYLYTPHCVYQTVLT